MKTNVLKILPIGYPIIYNCFSTVFFSVFTRMSKEESKMDKKKVGWISKSSLQKTFNWIVIFTTNRKGALRPWQMAYNFISIDGKLRKKCAAKHKLAMGNTS